MPGAMDVGQQGLVVKSAPSRVSETGLVSDIDWNSSGRAVWQLNERGMQQLGGSVAAEIQFPFNPWLRLRSARFQWHSRAITSASPV